MSEQKAELVTIVIDGKEVKVPKGMNLIDAAASAGIEIPHYCYHKHLSIAGNCRMCQVEIGGSPKLGIACNTTATEGLNVKTHFTSPTVAESQRATLEFLLINHPLDCTVCDQAGHCKLQDYYYEYDSKSSRFTENKVHKVKAEPLGPEVIYDGERCIMCTRCVRFCSEVTETSELGAYNRGDRGVIGVIPGHELDNPLSGTVVDLCPVGALTHRQWRFNTRYWYTSEEKTICTGCSTGCNARVAVRDDRIVQVKARPNSDVNKEWMCDEGRYGFERFQPTVRATEPLLRKGDGFHPVSWTEADAAAKKLAGGGDAAMLLSPFLALEDMWAALSFASQVLGLPATSPNVAVQLRTRPLTPVEAILVSPDYAPNARGFSIFDSSVGGDRWREQLEERYTRLLDAIRSGAVRRLVLVGDMAILKRDVDERLQAALLGCDVSVALTARGIGGADSLGAAHEFCQLVLPGRTVNERSGVMVNRDMRLQRVRRLLTPPVGSLGEWYLLGKMAAACGKPVLPAEVVDERGAFREMVKKVPSLSGLTLQRLGDTGVLFGELSTPVSAGSGSEARAGQ